MAETEKFLGRGNAPNDRTARLGRRGAVMYFINLLTRNFFGRTRFSERAHRAARSAGTGCFRGLNERISFQKIKMLFHILNSSSVLS